VNLESHDAIAAQLKVKDEEIQKEREDRLRIQHEHEAELKVITLSPNIKGEFEFQ
jgi:hypothetical protein